MFEELRNLVFDNEQMINNIENNAATVGFKGLRISAKVVDGKNLEDILGKEEIIR